MHTLRNRFLFFGATLAAGLGSMGLHRYMMNAFTDHKGLLLDGNLPGTLLWAVGIAFALFLFLLLRTIGGDGCYADNFPRSILSGSLMIAAGAVLLFAIPRLDPGADAPVPVVTGLPLLIQQATAAVMAYLPWAAAACMAAQGLCRILGNRPWPLFGGIICLFYTLMLITNYRLWSADPNLHSYAYQLLAQVLLMLCAFHRACCDAGVIQRKKLLATGLSAAVCATAALSMDFQRGFFLASALWAAGSVCSTAVLPPDPEDEEPEDGEPEQTEDTEKPEEPEEEQ